MKNYNIEIEFDNFVELLCDPEGVYSRKTFRPFARLAPMFYSGMATCETEAMDKARRQLNKLVDGLEWFLVPEQEKRSITKAATKFSIHP